MKGIYPHPTKNKGLDVVRFWYISIGSGRNQQRVPFEGAFLDACRFKQLAVSALKEEPRVFLAPALKELFLPFLEWYKNEVSASTLEDCQDTINLYIARHFGGLRPNQLTVDHFEAFKSELLGAGLKPVTINKHLNYFSSMIRWAVKHGHCKPLGFDLPRFPRKKIVSPPKYPLTVAEVDAILSHIEPGYKLLYLLMVDQGLRLHEALGLPLAAVDLVNQSLHVRGKGNKDRFVPIMSDRIEAALMVQVQARKNEVGKDWQTAPLVVNPETGRPYSTAWKPIDRAVNAAGIMRHVNHHILRHTFSTRMAESGMSPYVLQEILGHESIETTRKVYTHINRDHIGQEAKRHRIKSAPEKVEQPQPVERLAIFKVVTGGKNSKKNAEK